MRIRRRATWAIAGLLLAAGRVAADPGPAMAAAAQHVARHEAAIVAELRELLALPNVATNESDIRANADLLVRMLERRGIAASVLETPGAPVAVHGERRVAGATRTLLF
jgi:histidinol-phosphate/aromatic aminotransferase/cobyric acid decarboxylase-like protein